MALSPAASAVEYQVTPRVDQRLSYDDNIQLRADNRELSDEAEDQRDAYMYRIAPSLALRARGDAWSLDGLGGVEFERFDPSSFDTDNQRLQITARRFTERHLFQFDGSLRRQAQRTAEVDTSGLLEATRVETVTFRPSYQRQLTERIQLILGASYNTQHFKSLDLQDYENTGYDMTLARQMSARSVVDFAVFLQQFKPESRNIGLLAPGDIPSSNCERAGFQEVCSNRVRRESETLGVQLGWRYSFTSRLDFNMSAGWREVENLRFLDDAILCQLACGLGAEIEVGTVLQENTSTGLIARTGAVYRGDRYTYTVNLERSVSPVGLGFLIETDRVSGSLLYEFTPQMRGTTSVVFLDSGAVDSEVTFDRRYRSVDFVLEWRLSENWSIGPGVRWRDQQAEQETFVQEGDSISAFVNLNYRPQPVQISR